MFGLLKRKLKKTTAQQQWAMAKGREGNHPILFRYRCDIRSDIDNSGYPRLVNIYWRYASRSENGMPRSEDYERMLELEDELEALETTQLGILVLGITGNSRKEWVWYVQSDQAFIRALNSRLSAKAPFPIEIEASEDQEWSNYFQFLRQIADTDKGPDWSSPDS